MEFEYPPPDTVYLWKVLGKPIWKVGICNKDRLQKRIEEVSKTHNFEIETIVSITTKDCRKLENFIKGMGQTVDSVQRNDGYSEFRYFNEKELKKVLGYFN